MIKNVWFVMNTFFYFNRKILIEKSCRSQKIFNSWIPSETFNNRKLLNILRVYSKEMTIKPSKNFQEITYSGQIINFQCNTSPNSPKIYSKVQLVFKELGAKLIITIPRVLFTNFFNSNDSAFLQNDVTVLYC